MGKGRKGFCWGSGYKYGLWFEVIEDIDGGYGTWGVVKHPDGDKCEVVSMPSTKEELVNTAVQMGISDGRGG